MTSDMKRSHDLETVMDVTKLYLQGSFKKKKDWQKFYDYTRNKAAGLLAQ